VTSVSSSNYETFVDRDERKHKVLYFNDKKNTPALIKALSKRFKDKLFLGEVKETEKKLIKEFKLEKLPALIVITYTADKEGVWYEELEFKADKVSKFLTLHT
jgi:protein disulfide-isomerase A6